MISSLPEVDELASMVLSSTMPESIAARLIEALNKTEAVRDRKRDLACRSMELPFSEVRTDAMAVDKEEHAAGEADRMEAAGRDFHMRVRDGYLYLAKQYPDRVKVVESMEGIEETQAEIRRILGDVLF